MAKPLTIKVDGLKETLDALEYVTDEILQEIDDEMRASTEMMATVSKRIFSSENTEIRNSIRAIKNRPYKYELIAGYGDDPMAAYIEFGTGRYFPNYPGKEAEWQALAREYYINGKGWMRPAPYFYPSVMSGLVSLQSNIKQVLARNERL